MKNLAFVIEDNADFSEIYERALKTAGFHVEVIRDGAIAQERISEASPTLITLDMHMPNIDGASLLTQIRAEEHLKDSFVIIITVDERLGELYKDMADLTFIKPVAFTQLYELAARLI